MLAKASSEEDVVYVYDKYHKSPYAYDTNLVSAVIRITGVLNYFGFEYPALSESINGLFVREKGDSKV